MERNVASRGLINTTRNMRHLDAQTAYAQPVRSLGLTQKRLHHRKQSLRCKCSGAMWKCTNEFASSCYCFFRVWVTLWMNRFVNKMSIFLPLWCGSNCSITEQQRKAFCRMHTEILPICDRTHPAMGQRSVWRIHRGTISVPELIYESEFLKLKSYKWKMERYLRCGFTCNIPCLT